MRSSPLHCQPMSLSAQARSSERVPGRVVVPRLFCGNLEQRGLTQQGTGFERGIVSDVRRGWLASWGQSKHALADFSAEATTTENAQHRNPKPYHKKNEKVVKQSVPPPSESRSRRHRPWPSQQIAWNLNPGNFVGHCASLAGMLLMPHACKLHLQGSLQRPEDQGLTYMHYGSV